MPYTEFLNLLNRVKSLGMFTRWMSKDATGKPSSPIALLLLGSLRYLGRGLTFDDLEEYTAISEETHRQFFHQFIDYGDTLLFKEFIQLPTTAQQYATHRHHEFDIGGLTGAGFSTNATNVVMWHCSQSLKQANTGFKQSHPARSYNISCNHRRKILHTTKGHPSRWNDKTLAYFDTFLSGIHKGTILQDVRFHLLSWKDDIYLGDVEKTLYAGAWGLCDNGYHKWACTQAPAKVNTMIIEQ